MDGVERTSVVDYFVDADRSVTLLISPLAGEMAGRPEGGVKERQPRRSTAR